MKKLSFFLICFLILSMSVAKAQLFPNSDFESGTNVNCDCANGYTCNNDACRVVDGIHPVFTVGGMGCVFNQSYTNSLGAHNGTGYVYFYAGSDDITTSNTNFTAVEPIQLCVWYAGPQGQGDVGQNTADAHFSFGVDGAQVGPDVLVPVGTVWTQHCITVCVTAGSHNFSVLSGGSAPYSMWFDDFVITKVVNFSKVVITSHPNDAAVCEGDSITFSVSATGSDTITYQWYFNGNSITGATDSFYTVNPVSLNDAGNYYCIVSNICTNDTSNAAVLSIIYPPTVDLGIDTILCKGLIFVLDAHNNGNTYLWQDGSTKRTYAVSDSGYYWVTVSNLCGSATDSVLIGYRKCPPFLWVPNAFTPNVDGNNDVFRADGFDITKFQMCIYDRWGQLIFESDDITEAWDGTYNNKPCKDGVYVWIINYEGIGSPQKVTTGHVILLH